MNFMELRDAIKKRVSARNFSDKPISDEIIYEMLDAARLVPTPGNGQGNIVGVVKDYDLKIKLAQAAGGQMWIAGAPVVFALCADISWDFKDLPEDDFGLIVNYLRFGKEFINDMKQYPDRKTMIKLFANGGPCLPGEHIFLTAVSHGLSACFIGYLDTEKAAEILRLPEHIACLFLLPVGYAAEQTAAPYKKSVDEISFINTWDNEG
jgi:nitroreductase